MRDVGNNVHPSASRRDTGLVSGEAGAGREGTIPNSYPGSAKGFYCSCLFLFVDITITLDLPLRRKRKFIYFLTLVLIEEEEDSQF